MSYAGDSSEPYPTVIINTRVQVHTLEMGQPPSPPEAKTKNVPISISL